MLKITPISKEEAEEQGFTPITDTYCKHELDMLEDAIKTLKNKDYRVVKTKRGLVLYRLNSEVKELYSK